VSAQTGRPSLSPPPPSSRGVERLRGQVGHWRSSPNPVWLREMRQSARLTRTPFILMAVTSMTALLLCTVGGAFAANGTAPATTGVILHHTFFSVAFFVVTLAGAAVAANGIASEREGRTWEALLLTGLPPGVIARGKFMAAYSSIAMYIVTMAPVGALPFLFGGVTATEVVVAFVWLFLFAGLSVAFGLAISSRMESLRAALIVTLFAAVVLSPTIFVMFGPVLSSAVNEMWPQVPGGPPVWLPTAYDRAPFGLPYLGCLVFAPLLGVGLPAWFLYEVTIANLTSVTDDRSTGVRRWFVAAGGLVALGGALLPAAINLPIRGEIGTLAVCLYLSFLVFCAFVFAGEPIGPSRRVVEQWDKAGIGRLGRALGPGVVRATTTLLAVGLGGMALIGAVTMIVIAVGGGSRRTEAHALVVAFGYAAAFFVFVAGFTAWVRARTNSPGTARTMLLVVLFFTLAGPWIIAAIAGSLASSMGDESMVVAAPSPIYGLVAAAQIRHGTVDARLPTAAAALCSGAWALIGLGLLGRAAARCRSIVRAHEAALAESDAMLAAEDATLAEEQAAREQAADEQPALHDAAQEPAAHEPTAQQQAASAEHPDQHIGPAAAGGDEGGPQGT
jgi:ABC-type transport system involved in multi-copper enzyme maturation permease subunit